MRVLVACEYSGAVRDAFLARGHDAWSCDLLPTEVPGPHIQGDARDVLGNGWDLLVAHPPCTRLCNSGVRWLAERNLWSELDEAAALFAAFWNAPIARVAVENPIMHRHAKERIAGYHAPAQTIQPWQFGHGETKATCLWLRGLPNLVPTNVVVGREQRVFRLPPSADRWKKRSRTYPGIADAMAS
jgi:hypothetical protein